MILLQDRLQDLSTSLTLVHRRAQGFMFMSDNTTVNECLSKNIFGLPGHMMSRMDTISDYSLLFLYNKDVREVFGIFRASGRPGLNLDPTAYAPLSFPAQVRTATSFTGTYARDALLFQSGFLGPHGRLVHRHTRA